MDNFRIDGTMTLPTVDLKTDGQLSIAGRSIPEHPAKFYSPADEWIEKFLLTNPEKIHLSISLDYLNTHSTECLLLLMKKLESYNSNNSVAVTWFFEEEDEDMETLGEDLASMIKLPFTFKEIESD